MANQTISDDVFKIGLAELPAVLQYSSDGCVPLFGGDPPTITLHDRSAGKLLEGGDELPVRYECKMGASIAEYFGTVSILDGETRFVLRFQIESGRLSVGWECLKEEGLELVSISFPNLISVRESQPSGRIALTAHGGRLIDPAACECGSRAHLYNWKLDAYCGCAVIYNRDMTAVIRLNSLDDTLLSSVSETGTGKSAALGVRFRHRYTVADGPYTQVLPRIAPPCEDDAKTYPIEESFAVHSSSSISINLYRQQLPDPETGWVFGMKKMYGMLPPKRTDLYKDRFVYKIFIGNAGGPVLTTFDQALGIIKAVYDRTGGAAQICYIVGFQHEGHDSMYPDVFTVNAKAGGEKELLRLMREAEKYNAIVSFHDNYDEAYRASPMWDENDIAVGSTGHLLKGGWWNGGQSYCVSMARYAPAKSLTRIERTLAKYPIRVTYHVDVLSSVYRRDFRAGATKGQDDDLAARLDVVRQFRAKGIDVSSEGCGLPYIGEISFPMYMWRVPRPVYKGDHRIPAVPFLVHGKSDYGGGVVEGRELPDALLYAAFFSYDVTAATPLKLITDAYYMIQVPLNRLRDEEAVEYREYAGRKRVTYSSGSYVEVDFESGEFEVVIDGKAWVKDGTAFIPADGGEYTAYVAFRDGTGAPSFELPGGWEGNGVACSPMYGSAEAISVLPVNGKLTFDIPLGTACRVRSEKPSE